MISRASKVLFDSGKATLRPESFPILDELAALITDKAKKYPTLRVRLEGHTDTDGASEANLELSRNRARSVKEYLTNKGIDVMMISTAGYGEERLVKSPERTPSDKQDNRRVEIAITNQ
ncbi:MAG: OmpA family protein [Bacteroidia bacterium]|nr:OmpA family protein [Bacteroidia bacterium]